MLDYIRPYSKRVSLGVFIKFVGTLMDLVLPWILAYIIDSVIPLRDYNQIIFWGVMMVLTSILAVVLNIIANRIASAVARDTTENIRHDLFEKITYLSANQLDVFGIPSLVTRLTTDTYNVNHTVGRIQRMGIRGPILLLGGIMITMTLDPVLTLVLIGTMPFIGLTVYLVSKYGIPQFSKLQEKVDVLVQVVRENITGSRIIKALSKGNYEKQRFGHINETVVKAERKANLTMAINSPLMSFFLNTGLTIVIVVSAYRINGGMTQPGVLIAFLSYFTIILNAMMSITRIFVIISRGLASANRITTVLETEPDLLVEEDDTIETDYFITFDNVSFAYYKDQHTLSDINFSLKKGETLGIIGPTGSGKSTIIKLLMRLYDTDEGAIRINGRNVKSIPTEELHTLFGVAFQRDILFAETIEENINFGRDLPIDEIVRSTDFAQADEFIDTLNAGLKHAVNTKGSNLSGGQKQRVIVSRALAGDPDILILDDSSSALDYQTDAKLRRAINHNFQETTKIIIAQRISSIKHADHILMLDEGRIVGYGKHEDLLEKNDVYQEINESQMGGADLAG